MKQIIEIATKIEKANNTFAKQIELVTLNGKMGTPLQLAINAAKLVVRGHKLSFSF